MGDRVLIQLRTREEVSPILYLHWGGSCAAEIIHRAEKRMKSRGCDLHYAFARLVGAAHDVTPGNLSVGVWNAPTSNNVPQELTDEESHGDAGCIVVDITGQEWTANCRGGYFGTTLESVSKMATRLRRERKRRIAARQLAQHTADGAPAV